MYYFVPSYRHLSFTSFDVKDKLLIYRERYIKGLALFFSGNAKKIQKLQNKAANTHSEKG